METSALQASGSYKKYIFLHQRKVQECTCCMTRMSPTPGAGLAVASSFSLGRATTLLLAAFISSVGNPLFGSGKKEEKKSEELLYSCGWNSPNTS